MTGFIWHLVLHLVVPTLIAWFFFQDNFKQAALIMFSAILIDVDHLWADPIVDPTRCSVGFHVLHSYWLIPVYVLLSFWPKTRLLGLGLVIHIILDWLECL
ncbi:DUF6122 family protein [Pontibacter vulgaris]|uniref:DUF6122 family protein n=1 Tax=Pontibacter vulgaris TaxID=2905679 RepID=UPI001FA72F11|nr:DUF6122 family protein [Pontibacter vulgaris]